MADKDENQKRLSACTMHVFARSNDAKEISEYVCQRCGVVIDDEKLEWFDIGYKQSQSVTAEAKELLYPMYAIFPDSPHRQYESKILAETLTELKSLRLDINHLADLLTRIDNKL
jgi:hypothetical protein